VDCASGITLSEDKLACSSKLGYKSVRGVHGVDKGYFHFEVAVDMLGSTGALRVGAQTQWADLHGPVGIDQHGYGICSVDGNAVFNSMKTTMGRIFGEGDVVGVCVFLPDANVPRPRTREAVIWGKKLYWKQEPPYEDHVPVRGSFVEFYVNGEVQGRVENVFAGTFFPVVSLFTSPEQDEPVRVRCEFSEARFRYPSGCEAWSRARVRRE
jgi:hypothetical protein